ncbi:hypothetical protein [Myroides sp. DF42-4-2]|uniref:hypothetical protein n=1 Tax=unclassified Myroides TaxID=2642485 RepID=UPI002578863C|nr:hypothetical protein [Myroides sp. DF42-4-2]MDM1406843.1 hypothetical protein [Myroides sp. DF42-4-2]
MERKVTLQEIEELHRFVRQHYVEFYDVELELVDHLANDIETQWQKDTQLSFEQALEVAFKKFGVFGFSDVVEQKIKQLTNAYYKKSFALLKSFFTVPKIVVTLALFLVLFALIKQVNVDTYESIQSGLFFLGTSFLFYQLWHLYRQKQGRKKRGEALWLLHSVLYNLEIWPYYVITFWVIRFAMHRFSAQDNPVFATSSVVFSSLLLTLTVLYLYILKRVVVPQVEADLLEQKKKIVAE